MTWLKFTFSTYIIFVLHSAAAASLAVAGFAPNFVLAGLILMACRLAGRQGLLAAALWGLLADCMTSGRLGAGIICFSLSTWVLQRCTERGNSSLPWRLAVLSVPLLWADIVGMDLLRGLSDGRPVDLQGLCLPAAGSAVYTAIVVAVTEFSIRIVRGKRTEDAAIAVPIVSNKWKMLTE